MNESSPSLEQRLGAIQEKIAAAAIAAHRDPAAVKLIAVSKTVPLEGVQAAIAAGQRLLGENRVQEAWGKWPALKEQHPDIELHLIGPLQSNKAKEAVALFDVIHSLDRRKIAGVLAGEIARSGRCPRLLIQVNTGAEPQKAGVLPKDAEAFLHECRDALGLKIEGLMCIPPVDADPAPHFGMLAELAAKLGLQELSMGMSGDFETAIRCGATYVRVGTAIFGSRPPLLSPRATAELKVRTSPPHPPRPEEDAPPSPTRGEGLEFAAPQQRLSSLMKEWAERLPRVPAPLP